MWAQSGGHHQQQGHYQGFNSSSAINGNHHMHRQQQPPPGRYPHPHAAQHFTQPQVDIQYHGGGGGGPIPMAGPPQQQQHPPYGGPPHMQRLPQPPSNAGPPYGGGCPPGGPQPLMSILTVPPHMAAPRAGGSGRADIRLPDFSQPPPPIRQQQPPPPPPVTIRPRPPTQILKRSPQAPAYRGSHSTGRLPNNTSTIINTGNKKKVTQPIVTSSSSSSGVDVPTSVVSTDVAVVGTNVGVGGVLVDEDHMRTPYRPPDQPAKVKILKRPSSIPNNLEQQSDLDVMTSHDGDGDHLPLSPGSSGGGQEKSLHKSLKQREEEYAQARLRILGSAEPVTDEPAEEGEEGEGEEGKPVIIDAASVAAAANKNVVRSPHGPDGTKGFKLKR